MSGIRQTGLRQLLRWSGLFVCLCAVFPFLFFAQVSAASDPINVTARTDTLTFPRSIDFRMSANDGTALLTQATLYLKYGSGQSFQEDHQVNAVPHAHTVAFEWKDDLTNSHNSFTPSGTQISYYWVVVDGAGNTHTDVIQSFQVTDNRFKWQHLTQGLYMVNWYNRPTSFGQTVLGKVGDNIQRISQNLGGSLQKPINLWVYQTREDFQGSLPPQTHEWVGGIAFPQLNQASIVVDQTTDETMVRDMPHELTHLIFHQLTALGIAPIWFDEGLAVYNQDYRESDMASTFQNALRDHSLLRLNSITHQFPADADKAYLAYAQSWKLLDYMYTHFGQKKMGALIQSMHTRNQTFDVDVSTNIGMDIPHLENEWHISLGQPQTLTAEEAAMPGDPGPPVHLVPDSMTQVFLLLGMLLTLVSMCGLGGLMVYQRRERAKVLVSLQAQQMLTTAYDINGRLRNGLPAPYVNVGNYSSASAYIPVGPPPNFGGGQSSQQPWPESQGSYSGPARNPQYPAPPGAAGPARENRPDMAP